LAAGLAAGCRLLAACCWLLAAGRWLLAVGCWRLAAGCWLLAAGRTSLEQPQTPEHLQTDPKTILGWLEYLVTQDPKFEK
jgi:hypothetical protein